MSFDRELERFGVTGNSLSDNERAALDERGFVVLEGLLDRSGLETARTACEEALAADPGGTRHAPELDTRDEALALHAFHPRVLAAALHVLGRPFRVLLVSARDPQPGYGLQGLHMDWLPLSPREPYAVVTSLLVLDGFTETNGATRVVPGSHLRPGPVPRAFQAPSARHPTEELVQAPAGSALVFNGHLVHSGTMNRSDASRRILQLQLVARDRRLPSEAGEAGAAGAELSLEDPLLRFLARA